MAEEREILRINVDLGCSGQCESCEKFYECELEKKYRMYELPRMQRAQEIMGKIKHKIAVASGKGGVGKSICTVNIAGALTLKGNKVTILDQDFDGHSIPRMLGIANERHYITDDGIKPVKGNLGIEVISMGLIVKDEDVLTWFHKMRRGATEEFISHVTYGERDYLLVDLPPGTSSDSVNMMQYLPDLDGMVVITVPSEVSQNVAKKAILLARKAKVKVFGVIENMSGFICPECGKLSYVLQQGGGEKLAESMGVPLLGRIPMDARLSQSSDQGEPFVAMYPESPASKEMMKIVERLEKMLDGR